MENDLRHALDAGRVEVHYQPVVDLRDRKVRGVEALVRWRDVDGRLIEPAEFLPLAQETGLIVPLGWHVLRRAVSDGAAWCKGSSTDDEPFTVAVNLSTRQIESPDFVERILDELDRADLAPEHLVLEVTETDMLESVSDTRHKLGELHRLGVRIALDDFGTGYTSLQYLRDYPVDILKIDRTFVQGVHRRTDLTTLVRTIVDLGEAFQLEIIAEGVEDRDESQALRRLRCRLAQGYAFYRPMPAKEITAVLAGAPVGEVNEPG
jgi:EAL domain-containing protein (putative c-di-GMP-specific phosphodiesterase class I)